MKSQLRAVALVGALGGTLIGALPQSAFAETKLESDTEKLSYGLGMIIGERVLKNYGELDYDILMEAMKAQNEGSDTLMTIDDAQNIMREQQTKAAEAKSAEG